VFRKPKTFKLRALHGTKKFGVAGRSYQEVLRKGCFHFQLPITGSRLCLYEDGTELTGDYFSSVPDNSELVLLTSGQTWQGCKWWGRGRVAGKPVGQRTLSRQRAGARGRDTISTFSDEAGGARWPWTPGGSRLESRFKNKSGYLRYSCESRIRSYLREVSASASTVGAEAQEEYVRIVGLMCRKLRAEQYHSSYFDRGAEADSRLCTPEGWFSCQGPFDVDSCASKHSINPYGNRESRILFSTWNLDHIIEKRGTVIPTLEAAVAERAGREVSWEYFYSLLFTAHNLKLVHIACHKKTSHGLSCD
uniref:DNA fragmentation factor subunit beta n=1 Tax=Panthera tigris altaica TaxID=74533 RepID=A0A8C9KBE1_PANTA